MIKAIIFDCFGVIYPQATGNFFNRHKELFNEDSSALDKLNLQIDMGEITRDEFFYKLEAEIRIPAKKIKNEIDAELIADTRLVEYIQSLKKTYKIGLLSNAGEEEISIIYKDKLEPLFDDLTVSYKVGLVKPNSEIFKISARGLNVEFDECIFVDDSTTNIEAAQKLQMKTILYTDFDAFFQNFPTYLP